MELIISITFWSVTLPSTTAHYLTLQKSIHLQVIHNFWSIPFRFSRILILILISFSFQLICFWLDFFNAQFFSSIQGPMSTDENDVFMVPIIADSYNGGDLQELICNRMKNTGNPLSAILVRSHGLFVWGPTWDTVNIK